MRYIAILLIFLQSLWGYAYNELLLDAQSRIYPKLLMLEENISSRHEISPIVFTVVYAPEDEFVAERVVQKIESYYDHSFSGIPFEVEMSAFDELELSRHKDAIYILKGDDDQMKRTIKLAMKEKIPVFVYDFKDLRFGALFALTIEQSTVIYLNRAALHKTGLLFAPSLYGIVRFVDAE